MAYSPPDSPRSLSPEPEFLEPENPWTSKDNIRLVQAYISIHDGVEQFTPVTDYETMNHLTSLFRNRLINSFNDKLDFEDIRGGKEINDRWSEIKRDVNQFIQIHTTINNQYPDDEEEVVLNKAKDLFSSLNEGRQFDLVDAWIILKELPYF